MLYYVSKRLCSGYISGHIVHLLLIMITNATDKLLYFTVLPHVAWFDYRYFAIV